MVREHKPSLEDGINGAWLLAIVATQAVSVLGTLLAPTSARATGRAVLHLVHVLARRDALPVDHHADLLPLHVSRLTMDRLTPPYWINMGAVAITTLAGLDADPRRRLGRSW